MYDLAEPDEWSGLSGQEYIKAVDTGAQMAEGARQRSGLVAGEA
jgi:hypothetical protein